MDELEPFNAVIAVTDEKAAVVLATPDVGDIYYWARDSGIWADDNGFTNLPTEPGLYNCTIEARYRDHGTVLWVSSAEKVASIENGKASPIQAVGEPMKPEE